MKQKKEKENWVAWLMHNYRITFLLVGLMFLLGFVGLDKMAKAEFPDFTIRQGIVVAVYPGATAEEVEAQVARPLERYLFTYDEVKRKKTTSTSSNGLCTMMVELQDDVNNKDEVDLTTEEYYWQVVSLQKKRITLESLRKMLEQLEKDVTVSVNAGVTTRNDLLQVQLKHNEVESQILQIENSLSLCNQLLAQYIGKNGQNIQVVADIPYTEKIALPERYDHMAALTVTPQYRLLEKNVESNRLQHRIKVGEQLPSVSGGAVYTWNNVMGEGRGVGILIATVSVPISGWWGGSHAIKKQKLALDQAREELQDNSQKLIINMNNCWANVETSQRQLAIAYKSIEQSDENLRLNNNYYRAGTTTMSNLLDAQSCYQQARDKYVDAYIEYQESILKYQQAVGVHPEHKNK